MVSLSIEMDGNLTAYIADTANAMGRGAVPDAEHEGEITLHKAAKKFFDDQVIQKLPSVKSLQAEYAALMEEKKSAYAEYEDMKDLLTAKANIARRVLAPLSHKK